MSPEMGNRLVPAVSERDHVQGSLDAPVVFVEYGDYECPHCLQAHSIVQELQDRLGERACFVYRHFPIRSSHPHAQHAAEAAEAAGAQGKFWEMHDLLFENQEALLDENLIEYARQIGLDQVQFQRDLAEGRFKDRVLEDFKSGVRSGVNGTPTFYINDERYDGPWDVESLVEEAEKPIGVQVRNLFNRFTRLQASGGILLVFATLLALILANSNLSSAYFDFWKTDFSITFGEIGLSKYLLKWVNDGLMVLFFFVVGLEIKREVTVGELASPRKAALPLMAAIGGMLLPATLYVLLNAGTEGMNGWAIPMATDIAFMLGLLALLGRRVPLSLRVFFTALAIVDDLGAVLVIALFYTSDILWMALGIGGLILLLLIALNWLGVRNPMPYALLGIGLWLAFLQSGVHPTIAGVLLALTIPSQTRMRAQAFMAQCIAVLGGVEGEDLALEGAKVQMSDRRQAAAHALEAIAERMQSPAQRLEHSLTPWATYLVLPIFALANAGVAISTDLGALLSNRVALGIIIGLVLGKSLGITLFTWLAIKLGIAEMPSRVGWPQLFSATWLTGIGFTMALFIANSAFADPTQLATAKLAILAASLISGLIGFSLLILTSNPRDRHTELEVAAATL
jgi:NhaA family Na+:H+ antiporter